MDATWHRLNIEIFDRSQRPGTVSLYFDYNLAHWTLGIRIEHDPHWIATIIELGPLSFDLTYWRQQTPGA